MPERADPSGIEKPLCGCGLAIHFVFYILVYIDGNYRYETIELELNVFRNLEAYL